MSGVSTDVQSTYYRDPETGFLMMPGTRRPDGTWRKPRRIKDGYVPQDEVPLYESKGKQWAKSKETSSSIPGLPYQHHHQQQLSQGILNMKIDTFNSADVIPVIIPGLGPVQTSVNKENKNNKKKKNKGNNNSNPTTTQFSSSSNPPPPPSSGSVNTGQNSGGGSCSDPAKKIRNLKKKLRDIEALETKLANGEIENPDPEQLEKVARKATVQKEIKELEQSQI